MLQKTRLAAFATAAVAALSVGGSIGATAGAAGTVDFSCSVDSGHWCLHDVRHTYFEGSTLYPRTDARPYVCQKMIRDSDGSTFEQSCGYGVAQSSFTNPSTLIKPLMYNGSAANNLGLNGHGAY